ncbi:nucleoside triphosphate pyrophosphohydrolase [Mycobacterium sp. AZCC_0083]|uniref:nucleoside triphosphate pyrophosphohydrolase n=1 Tax=Mycobacterium sp. AZCC_0083 TaxID=2735882 RepID=UPI00160AB683|nr:nucleoside triphosphate pyrophosphohydrolase [Mycobacterium sp. AZCC_0083]MBB5162698.1 XTP/dITP diphosphohydrolase [Mycobacterium sp. AZCC_0083]
MTVVLVDPRRPSLVPVDAVALLAGDVQYTEEMPVKVPWSLPAARPAYDGEDAPVLLSSDPNHPKVRARLEAGEKVISAPGPQRGDRLVDAVALMDRLRTTGPWESEQTHDSLRRYLLEETYELFDAVRSGDAGELREELGDVLLQVLFHARIAEDATQHAFTIDDVADSLVRKLNNRAPSVLAGESISLDEQLAQWEERKADEKRNKGAVSAMDDVPTGQPALALTQKVFQRVIAAGLPVDLIPDAMTSIVVSLGDDAENTLRSATLEFMDTVRKVEHAVAASRRPDDVPEVLDISQLGVVTEEEWRAHWPTVEPEVEPVPELDESEPLEADDDEPVEPEASEDSEEPEEPEASDESEDSDEAADEPEQPDQEKSVEPQ